jgi:CDP-diacylglycerol pyrophosphatase
MTRTKLTFERKTFQASPGAAGICVCAGLILLWGVLLGGAAAQKDMSRKALWEVVHNVCVVGQSQYKDPKPCLHVDLAGGAAKGFAILKDPRGANQFLLVPTTPISGIESPDLLGPNAINYFASAWEARRYINEALRRMLPRDAVGLAINSTASRSQDQMHIHLTCVRADVWGALRKNEGSIGEQWARFDVPFFKHYYWARWVPGENLGASNPFRLLTERPGAARDMGNQTLVVVGLTRTDGTKGFVLLADQVGKPNEDLANGEELLDHSCRIAANPALKN